MQRAQVLSLAGELKSHVPCCGHKFKKEKKRLRLTAGAFDSAAHGGPWLGLKLQPLCHLLTKLGGVPTDISCSDRITLMGHLTTCLSSKSPVSGGLEAPVGAGCDRRVQFQTPGEGTSIRRELLSLDAVADFWMSLFSNSVKYLSGSYLIIYLSSHVTHF